MKFYKILVDDLSVQRDQTPLRLGDAAGVQPGLRYFVRVQADNSFRREKAHTPDQVPHLGDGYGEAHDDVQDSQDIMGRASLHMDLRQASEKAGDKDKHEAEECHRDVCISGLF